jgi:hypothetical protein
MLGTVAAVSTQKAAAPIELETELERGAFSHHLYTFLA